MAESTEGIRSFSEQQPYFAGYVSTNKHIIVNSSNLLRLLFFIVANDNAQ